MGDGFCFGWRLWERSAQNLHGKMNSRCGKPGISVGLRKIPVGRRSNVVVCNGWREGWFGWNTDHEG